MPSDLDLKTWLILPVSELDPLPALVSTQLDHPLLCGREQMRVALYAHPDMPSTLVPSHTDHVNDKTVSSEWHESPTCSFSGTGGAFPPCCGSKGQRQVQ